MHPCTPFNDNPAFRVDREKKRMTTRKWRWGSVLLFCLVTVGTAWADDAGKLDTLRQAIRLQGAQWQAAETSISRLSPAERRKRMGWNPPEKVSKSKQFEPDSVYPLPKKLDWRDHGGNWVTPVQQQGACGSCWAFASIAAIESAFLLSEGKTYEEWPIDLSEGQAFACAPLSVSCETGGNAEYTYDIGMDVGITVEECLDYSSSLVLGSSNDISCTYECDDWTDQVYKLRGYTYITTGEYHYPEDIERVKAALQYGPVVAGLAIFSDFSYYAGGIYRHVWGDYEAGHLVLLVGYDDDEQCWIAKNSWGAFWGENGGYFRVAYDDAATNIMRWVSRPFVEGDQPPGSSCNNPIELDFDEEGRSERFFESGHEAFDENLVGSCGGNGKQVVLRFEVESASAFSATLDGSDAVLYVRSACDEETSEIVCDSGGSSYPGTGDCYVTVENLEPGTYYLFADTNHAEAGEWYHLQAELHPVRGLLYVEPTEVAGYVTKDGSLSRFDPQDGLLLANLGTKSIEYEIAVEGESISLMDTASGTLDPVASVEDGLTLGLQVSDTSSDFTSTLTVSADDALGSPVDVPVKVWSFPYGVEFVADSAQRLPSLEDAPYTVTFPVDADGPVYDVSVCLKVRNGMKGTFSAVLETPTDRSVDLFEYNPRDRRAVGPVVCFGPDRPPFEDLNILVGQEARGDWLLHLNSDDYARFEAAALFFATMPCDASSCDDDNGCTADICLNEGECGYRDMKFGQPCKDDLYCTVFEHCDAGQCVGAQREPTFNFPDCGVPQCYEEDEKVLIEPMDERCDDGDVCNGPETCNLLLGCMAGEPLETDDGIDCTNDGCDPVDGVFHEADDNLCEQPEDECREAQCDEAKGCVVSFTSHVACSLESGEEGICDEEACIAVKPGSRCGEALELEPGEHVFSFAELKHYDTTGSSCLPEDVTDGTRLYFRPASVPVRVTLEATKGRLVALDSCEGECLDVPVDEAFFVESESTVLAAIEVGEAGDDAFTVRIRKPSSGGCASVGPFSFSLPCLLFVAAMLGFRRRKTA